MAAEGESAELAREAAGHDLLASTVVLAEVPRALSRRAPENTWAATWADVLRRTRLIDVDRRLLGRSAQLLPPALRTLDAIHLVTALSVVGLGAFVAYDHRLLDAASAAGLAILSPGRQQ